MRKQPATAGDGLFVHAIGGKLFGEGLGQFVTTTRSRSMRRGAVPIETLSV